MQDVVCPLTVVECLPDTILLKGEAWRLDSKEQAHCLPIRIRLDAELRSRLDIPYFYQGDVFWQVGSLLLDVTGKEINGIDLLYTNFRELTYSDYVPWETLKKRAVELYSLSFNQLIDQYLPVTGKNMHRIMTRPNRICYRGQTDDATHTYYFLKVVGTDQDIKISVNRDNPDVRGQKILSLMEKWKATGQIAWHNVIYLNQHLLQVHRGTITQFIWVGDLMPKLIKGNEWNGCAYV